ncbi:uncharacterized protein LOC129975163 [Argiope bruennichi]|uniref:uncharacterized protein LOC129975163 n=1 Tax=Argiope bruennichi TaxID=94029 RepID=UPI002493D4B7|nr:uncharacterized protein LOC129975163 [Argiope bruennichi]XP_055944103.1 uncharacterized protein LOC129975163 [Argiope bruennichi]
MKKSFELVDSLICNENRINYPSSSAFNNFDASKRRAKNSIDDSLDSDNFSESNDLNDLFEISKDQSSSSNFDGTFSSELQYNQKILDPRKLSEMKRNPPAKNSEHSGDLENVIQTCKTQWRSFLTEDQTVKKQDGAQIFRISYFNDDIYYISNSGQTFHMKPQEKTKSHEIHLNESYSEAEGNCVQLEVNESRALKSLSNSMNSSFSKEPHPSISTFKHPSYSDIISCQQNFFENDIVQNESNFLNSPTINNISFSQLAHSNPINTPASLHNHTHISRKFLKHSVKLCEDSAGKLHDPRLNPNRKKRKMKDPKDIIFKRVKWASDPVVLNKIKRQDNIRSNPNNHVVLSKDSSLNSDPRRKHSKIFSEHNVPSFCQTNISSVKDITSSSSTLSPPSIIIQHHYISSSTSPLEKRKTKFSPNSMDENSRTLPLKKRKILCDAVPSMEFNKNCASDEVNLLENRSSHKSISKSQIGTILGAIIGDSVNVSKKSNCDNFEMNVLHNSAKSLTNKEKNFSFCADSKIAKRKRSAESDIYQDQISDAATTVSFENQLNCRSGTERNGNSLLSRNWNSTLEGQHLPLDDVVLRSEYNYPIIFRSVNANGQNEPKENYLPSKISSDMKSLHSVSPEKSKRIDEPASNSTEYRTMSNLQWRIWREKYLKLKSKRQENKFAIRKDISCDKASFRTGQSDPDSHASLDVSDAQSSQMQNINSLVPSCNYFNELGILKIVHVCSQVEIGKRVIISLKLPLKLVSKLCWKYYLNFLVMRINKRISKEKPISNPSFENILKTFLKYPFAKHLIRHSNNGLNGDLKHLLLQACKEQCSVPEADGNVGIFIPQNDDILSVNSKCVKPSIGPVNSVVDCNVFQNIPSESNNNEHVCFSSCRPLLKSLSRDDSISCYNDGILDKTEEETKSINNIHIQQRNEIVTENKNNLNTAVLNPVINSDLLQNVQSESNNTARVYLNFPTPLTETFFSNDSILYGDYEMVNGKAEIESNHNSTPVEEVKIPVEQNDDIINKNASDVISTTVPIKSFVSVPSQNISSESNADVCLHSAEVSLNAFSTLCFDSEILEETEEKIGDNDNRSVHVCLDSLPVLPEAHSTSDSNLHCNFEKLEELNGNLENNSEFSTFWLNLNTLWDDFFHFTDLKSYFGSESYNTESILILLKKKGISFPVLEQFSFLNMNSACYFKNKFITEICRIFFMHSRTLFICSNFDMSKSCHFLNMSYERLKIRYLCLKYFSTEISDNLIPVFAKIKEFDTFYYLNIIEENLVYLHAYFKQNKEPISYKADPEQTKSKLCKNDRGQNNTSLSCKVDPEQNKPISYKVDSGKDEIFVPCKADPKRLKEIDEISSRTKTERIPESSDNTLKRKIENNTDILDCSCTITEYQKSDKVAVRSKGMSLKSCSESGTSHNKPLHGSNSKNTRPCIFNTTCRIKNEKKCSAAEIDVLFQDFDLFKEDGVLYQYYKHVRGLGEHTVNFDLIEKNENDLNDEMLKSYRFLKEQLNYHKSLLRGLISVASSTHEDNTRIIRDIVNQLDFIKGYEVACDVLFL